MHTFIVNNAVARVLHITTKQSINTQKIPICRRGWACSSRKNKGQNQFINQHTEYPFMYCRGGVSPPENQQKINAQNTLWKNSSKGSFREGAGAVGD